MKKYIGIESFEQLIELEHGKIGSESCVKFASFLASFNISLTINICAFFSYSILESNLQKKLEQKKVTSQKLKMEKEISICLR